MASSTELPVYTQQQVSKHNTPNDVWVVIREKVYDVSGYLETHPGGKDILMDIAGVDATSDFDFVGHSDDATKTLLTLEIGLLADFKASTTRSRVGVVTKSPFKVGQRFRLRWFMEKKALWIAVIIVSVIPLFLPYMNKTFMRERKLSLAMPAFWFGTIAASLAWMVVGSTAIYFMRKELFPKRKEVFDYTPYYPFECCN